MKYIAYCRKSRDEADKQILSIEAQIAELQEFAKKEKIEIVEFVEEAKTAKAPGREKFAQVIKSLEKGYAQGIIAWHPDRLARNSIDGGKVIYLLDTGKLLDLKFPTFWFDNTPQGKFMLNIAFGQSKYYIDNLSENVKRGLRQKIRNGVWPHKPTYGYINNPKTRGIDIVPEEAKGIKKAFEVFVNGSYTYTEIANYLFKFGLKQGNDKPIHINQVRKILSDKFYIGILKYKGEYHPGSQELFIPKDLFQKAQLELVKRERHFNKSFKFEFLGLAKCRECGASITAERKTKFYKGTNRWASYTYYRCTKKLGPCSQKALREFEMESQIREIISSVSIPESWKEKWLEFAKKDEIEEKQNSEVKVRELKNEIESLDKKMNILLDSFLEGIVETEIYKTKKNEIFEEKIRIQEKIATIEEGGSNRLEPLREFIEVASQCEKIARAKNNCDDLANIAKRVGSDFYLYNRQLFPVLKEAFDTVRAHADARTLTDPENPNSLCVGGRRVELRPYDPQPYILPLNYPPLFVPKILNFGGPVAFVLYRIWILI